jgi:hypothetical protein
LPGSTAFGFWLSAFDGTVVDLAATDENKAEFAVPTGGRRPRARLVTLNDCGTRRGARPRSARTRPASRNWSTRSLARCAQAS